jgi:putative transposase
MARRAGWKVNNKRIRRLWREEGLRIVAQAVNGWCRFNGAGSLFIDPDPPWQNAWIEPYNGRLGYEPLNSWHLDSLLEARVIIEDWNARWATKWA